MLWHTDILRFFSIYRHRIGSAYLIGIRLPENFKTLMLLEPLRFLAPMAYLIVDMVEGLFVHPIRGSRVEELEF